MADDGDEELSFASMICGSKLEIDAAELSVTLPAAVFELYAVNEQCYECKDVLVTSGSENMCFQFWTPHEWDFKLFQDGVKVSTASHTFGDHGRYTLTVNSDVMHINEVESPVNVGKPLWLAAIFLVTLIIAYATLTMFKEVILACLGITSPEDNRHLDVKTVIEDSDMDASTLTRSLLEDDKPPKSAPGKNKAKERLTSLDTFRGFALTIMIFVNYGGGGYWFFEHSDWNGLTIADLVFPWFIFMMGVSMHLSFRSMAKRNLSLWQTMAKILTRTTKLFCLGLFLNNGHDLDTWRIPGVLQYFAVAYFVNAMTTLVCSRWVAATHAALKAASLEKEGGANVGQAGVPQAPVRNSGLFDNDAGMGDDAIRPSWVESPPSNSGGDSVGCCGGCCSSLRLEDRYMLAYWPEWVIQGIIMFIYLAIHLGGKAPDCPRGYAGAGGLANDGNHEECTGGIHRYIDTQLFGADHIYDQPTCKRLYECQSYDPEGALGALTAITVTYIGLMAGRALQHYPGGTERAHWSRLSRWVGAGLVLCFIAGCLCEFAQEGGAIPVNKNMWSTSFGLVTAGGGLLGLSLCYLFCDVLKLWSGAPFNFMGMNSILLYCSHDVFSEFFPFSYDTNETSHEQLLVCNMIGTGCWLVLSYYFFKTGFFWKL